MADRKKNTKLTAKQNLIQILKFVAFSLGAGIIQIVSYTLLFEITEWGHWKCYLPSLVLSVLYNFTVTRRYTFKSAANVPVAMMKVGIYYLIFTPLSTYLGGLAETAGVNNYVIEAVTMVTNLVPEFLVCRFWVYRTSMTTGRLAEKPEKKGSLAGKD